jgi:ribonuclease HI
MNCGSGSLGKNQTADDAEVAAIEEGIKTVSKSQQAFKHLSIFSDSTSAIARVKHNKTGRPVTSTQGHPAYSTTESPGENSFDRLGTRP